MTAVFKGKNQLTESLTSFREKGAKIGFVPTMGALHQGHLSLLKKCRNENDIVVCSIFVNPSQFNNPDDFSRYPRMLDADLELISGYDVDIVFAPEAKEMYPENENTPSFEPGNIATVLEGAYRPGHFEGVVTIIHKLFSVVEPDAAYFGQKDFQQYLIIKRFSELHFPSIEIKLGSTVRETSGLAMSSRNMLLTEEQTQQAAHIYQVLLNAKELIKSGENIARVKENSFNSLKDKSLLPEYFEVVDADSLTSITEKQHMDNILICTAVKLGNIRLIDNILI